MSKTMIYKDDNTGDKYKISWSEELQLKNINVSKKQVQWQKINFVLMTLLLIIILVFAIAVIYTLFKLDNINFFTNVAYR